MKAFFIGSPQTTLVEPCITIYPKPVTNDVKEVKVEAETNNISTIFHVAGET